MKTKSKPKFQVNIRPTSLSPFRELVREAIQISEKLNAAYNGRLSGVACLKEAMALARCSQKHLAEVREALSDGQPGLDRSRASVARIKRELLHTRRLNTIPKDAGQLISRLRYYAVGAAEELTVFKASVLTLLCVAIAETTEEKPEVFGTVDNSADLSQGTAELLARQQELFDKIGRNITMDEIDPGTYSQGKTSPALFKGTSVPLAPPDSAGKRLVEYLMSHRT